MDTVLDKFGIFDFMGIMSPGMITLSYNIAVMYILFNDVNTHEIISSELLFISLYIILSYFLGIILHEVGKNMFDGIGIFNADSIVNLVKENLDEAGDYVTPTDSKMKNECVQYLRKLFKQYPALCTLSFDKASTLIKYKSVSESKRIDTYHSVYAQSRGLFVSFTFQILFHMCLIVYINHDETFFISALACIILIDVFLSFCFLFRAKRYYLMWIKNVYSKCASEFNDNITI